MSKDKERLSGKAFENLVFKIYQELEPFADIKKNDKIFGLESGALREIDISIRKKIADHEILIIIQAKDQKRKADINLLGVFVSVIRDVRASRGILICNAGFTRTAKDFAKNKGIDLYTAHDASVKDWQSEIKIPIIRKHTFITYGVGIPFEITKDTKISKLTIQAKTSPEGFVMQKPDGTETSFLKEFTALWNAGKIDTTPGKHKAVFDAYMDIFQQKNIFEPRLAELNYEVKVRNYFKLFNPTDYRGIKNFITEKFRPSFLKYEEQIPFHNDKTWKYIENPAEISIDSLRLEIDVVDVQNIKFIRAAFKE